MTTPCGGLAPTHLGLDDGGGFGGREGGAEPSRTPHHPPPPPQLPLLITGSEDETVKIWQMATYRLETSLDYGLERVWAVAPREGREPPLRVGRESVEVVDGCRSPPPSLGACPPGTNKLAIGCDKGTVVVKVRGLSMPPFRMEWGGGGVLATESWDGWGGIITSHQGMGSWEGGRIAGRGCGWVTGCGG